MQIKYNYTRLGRSTSHGVEWRILPWVHPNNFPPMGQHKSISLPVGPRCLWSTMVDTVTEKLPQGLFSHPTILKL